MIKVIRGGKESQFIGLLIFFAIILLNALGPYFGIQKVVTFGLLPLLVLLSINSDRSTFNIGSFEIKIFTAFFIVSLLSIYYYVNFKSLLLGYSGLLGAVMAAYISVGINKNRNYEFYFHVGYIVSIIILILIMYVNGNISVNIFSSSRDRGRFLLNANFYSYISYFANFSLFYLYLKRKNLLTLVLLFTLPILFIIVAFATQSRSAILFIVFSNVCFWLFINKNEIKNVFVKFLRMLVITGVIIFFSIKFIDTFQNSQIKNRVSSSKEDSRAVLVKEGITIFIDKPLLGVGLSQFPTVSGLGQFTHNSFVEAFVEHGIVGGVLILILFFTPSIQSFKNLKKYPKNSMVRLNTLFFITFLMYNNAYVFYKFSFSMLYFFLIVSSQYKLNVQLEKEEKTLVN